MGGLPKEHYAFQVAHYVHILEALGLSDGSREAFIIGRDGQPTPYLLHEPIGARNPTTWWDSYQNALQEASGLVSGATPSRSALSATCKLCHWYSRCKQECIANDDLTLIAELGRSKRDAMIGTIPTVSALAACIRPKNKKADRIDRRLAVNQKPGKRCVFVMRQKCQELAAGAVKTLTFVIKGENQTDVSNLAESYVKKGSTICADESNAYDPLHAKFDTRRVNHSVEYKADDGTTNNLAESYFARFRRMQYGQVHKFGNLYLANYANEAAYREDTRRWANGRIFTDIMKKCARTLTNRDWCGYWQGNKRQTERLAV